MKKIIASLLSFVIIAGLGHTGPALLAAADSKTKLTTEKVTEIALKRYSELFGDKLNENDYSINVDESKDPYSGGLWNVSMNSQKNDYSYIGMTVDDNSSTVTNISRNKNYDSQANQAVSLITRDEGKQAAYEFIKKANPDKVNEIKEDTSMNYDLYNVGLRGIYYYSYVRMVNNIPVIGDGISVVVDSRTKDIIQYNYKWTDIKFPEVKKDIGNDEAFKLFKDSFSMEPVYQALNNNKVKLVYSPNCESYCVDAETGKFVGYDGKEVQVGPTQEKDITDKQKQEIRASAKVPNTKTLSKDDITKKAEAFLNKYVGKEYFVNSVNSGSSTDQSGETIQTWYLDIGTKIKNQDNMNMEFNAKTGELINFNRYIRDDFSNIPAIAKSTKSITWDKAYNIAIGIIAENCPALIDSIETKQKNSNSQNYYNGEPIFAFDFRRTCNNIPCSSWGININIDNLGKLQNFSLSWNNNAKFEQSKAVVTADAAKENFLKNCDTKLMYLTYSKTDDKGIAVPNAEKLAKAVYNFNSSQSQYIDALNGDALDYIGNKLSINQGDNVSVGNSVYGKEIQLFKDSGIIDSYNFKVEDTITKRDLLKIIMRIKGINESYVSSSFTGVTLNYTDIDENDSLYNTIKAAVKLGILKNEKTKLELDKPATRLDMAIFLVRDMGFDTVADKKDIFNVDYKDKDKLGDYAGYAAILEAFGVFERSDTFDPDKQVSWGEAIHEINNCMKYIKNNIMY